MASGVYMIKNLLTGKFYIGSSVNIPKRIKHHLWELRTNRHANKYLQRSFLKKSDHFVWGVVKMCDKESIRDWELFYIHFWKPDYNLMISCESGFTSSKEISNKISQALKGIKMSKTWRENINKALGIEPVGIYTMDGDLIKTFGLIKDAAVFCKCHPDSIRKAIRTHRPLLRGKFIVKQGNDLQTKLSNNDIPSRSNIHYKALRISKGKELIGEFTSILEASEKLNINNTLFTKWIKGVNNRRGYTITLI